MSLLMHFFKEYMHGSGSLRRRRHYWKVSTSVVFFEIQRCDSDCKKSESDVEREGGEIKHDCLEQQNRHE